MTEYRLTRYLYALDEVALSLLTALLCRRDLDECYYWTAELHASGFEVFPWLWWIYYSFYAELSPRLEAYMRARASCGTYRDLCAIIRNMHRARSSPTVFLLDQAASAGTLVARVTSGEPFTGFPEAHQGWLRCVKDHDVLGAVPHLIVLAQDWSTDSLFQMLCEFHAEHMGASIDAEKMGQYWAERVGTDDLHHLVALMVHMLRAPGEYEYRRLFIAPREDAMGYLAAGEPFGRPDRLLSAGRKYATGTGLGAFALAREELHALPAEVLRHHWEYHAAMSPLWRTRLHDCGGNPVHATHSVRFRTDEGLEAFYALYGLEPDEQAGALQALSTAEPMDGEGGATGWLQEVFGLQPSGGADILPKDWKFRIRIDRYFR